MSIRDDFFAAQAKASLWDVAVSIKRGNPLPLDANSVFKAYGTVGGADYAGSLLEYVTDNPVAYPGQICAVVGADATTIYYLDQNLAIQPVGIIPTGDGKSIDVAEGGEISLHGFGNLTDSHVGYLPRVKKVIDIAAAEGVEEVSHLEIEWAPVSAIVEGDGNSVTEVAAGCPCINVEDKAEADFEGHQYEVSLNISANAGNILEEKEDGLYASVHVPEYAIKKDERTEGATETTYHLTKDGTNVDVAIVVPDAYNDEALAGRVGALETKVDTGDKNVSAYVAEKIADAAIGKLTKVIADSVTEDGKVVIGGETTDPAEHVIYMVKVETAIGDMYKEYQVIGGELVQTGDTSTDLSGYVPKTTKINGNPLEGDVELESDDIKVSENIQTPNAFEGQTLTEALNALSETANTANSKTAENINVQVDSVGTIEDALIALKNSTINGKAFNEMLGSAYVWSQDQVNEVTLYGTDIAVDKDNDTRTIAKAIEDAEGAVETLATEVDNTYAKKATDLAGYGIKDAYTKNETDEAIRAKISEMTGGESAADVLGLLNDYKASNDREVWGDQFVTDHTKDGKYDPAGYTDSQGRAVDSRIDILIKDLDALEEAVGHDVNGENPATKLFLEVDEARKQADKGINDAKAAMDQATINKKSIEDHQAAYEELSEVVRGNDSGTVVGHAGKIAALEAEDLIIKAQIATLQGIDSTLQGTVAEQGQKIIALESKDAELAGLIAGNTAKFNDYSTTTQVEGLISTAVSDKLTEKDLEPYAKTEDVDKTYAKKADVANTYATIAALEVIYKAGNEELGTQDDGLLAIAIGDIKRNAADIATLVGADENKTVRTIAQEEIAYQLAEAPDAFDTLIDIATWLETHSTDAVNMDKRIKANEDKLAGFGGEGQPAVVKTYIDDSIAAIKPYELPVAKAEKLGGIESAADVEGVAVANAVYVANDGKASVKAISTDTLVNGEAELVLNGGNAAGATA